MLVRELDAEPRRRPRRTASITSRLMVRPLVWHEPAADLCKGLARDDGLGALALVSAADPVELERRPEPDRLKGRKPGLGEERVDPEKSSVGLFVPAELPELRALPGGRVDHVVVEPGHVHPAVLRVQRGQIWKGPGSGSGGPRRCEPE